MDECAEGKGGCEVKCNNTIGSFHCECLEGFEIATDGRTCIGKYVNLVTTCTYFSVGSPANPVVSKVGGLLNV